MSDSSYVSNTLPLILHPGHLASVFSVMGWVMRNASPEHKAQYGVKMTRWKTLSTLKHSYLQFAKDGPYHAAAAKSASKSQPSAFSSTLLDRQTLLKLFVQLQQICKSEDLCSRRGCIEEGKARCSICKMAMYCGGTCQKKYASHFLSSVLSTERQYYCVLGIGRSISWRATGNGRFSSRRSCSMHRRHRFEYSTWTKQKWNRFDSFLC